MTLFYFAFAMAAAEPVKIAVIDSGYSANVSPYNAPLCNTGHYNFIKHAPEVGNELDHGSIVAGLLAERLDYYADVDYCLIIYTVIGRNEDAGMAGVVSALRAAKREGVVAVNMSIVGREPYPPERAAIEALILGGAKVFVAAGNDGKDLDWACTAFPACYKIPGINVVGANDPNGKRASKSNYGKVVNLWRSGDYHGRFGTSFASPRALADSLKGAP